MVSTPRDLSLRTTRRVESLQKDSTHIAASNAFLRRRVADALVCEIAELDCNPVVVLPSGVTVVDARVRVEAPVAPLPLSARLREDTPRGDYAACIRMIDEQVRGIELRPDETRAMYDFFVNHPIP